MRRALIAVVTCCLLHALACAQVYDDPDAAKSDPDFELQGEYVDDTRGMQVIAEGESTFRVKIYQHGLPGAGWDGSEIQQLEADDSVVASMVNNFRRADRKSPTLNAKPPGGAVVLFDGTRESLQKHWKPGARMTDDGLLMEGCSSIDTFGDYTIHLEFRTPYMPQARGQARGNSGLYHQGRYETQILDSFGLDGKNNETGGIYEIRDPDLNVCLPPLVWQTYDVDFTAARYGDDGQKVAPAKMTVRLNGVVVHREVEVPRVTRAAPVKEGPAEGPIHLQNHGNPVRFRNIWVKPRDVAAEARRPIVPGIERTRATASSVSTGRVLLAELNCVACHQADDRFTDFLQPKQAPILDDVGQRLHPQWMVKYLAHPRSVKPGTTMPDVMGGMSDQQRHQAALALTNFLVAEKTTTSGGKRGNTANGNRLFHQVGCVACHLPRDGGKANLSSSVPLIALEDKYSRSSLSRFLKDPLAVRPSGRMPRIGLNDDQWNDIAQYLTGDTSVSFGNQRDRPKTPNMRFDVFHGNWDALPDFDHMRPAATGVSRGLDISVAGRSESFAIRFEGFLPIEKPGTYHFRLSSDDGSRLWIDDRQVIDNDGVHPDVATEGSVTLAAGSHSIRVDYFEKGGEEALSLQWAGPEIKSGLIDKAIVIDRDSSGVAADLEPPPVDPEAFVFDSSLVNTGRQLFSSLGCAACHQYRDRGRQVASELAAPRLSECRTAAGCLADSNQELIPNYELLDDQVDAILAALVAGEPNDSPPADVQLAHTLTSLNCYACHRRGEVGGPESDRNVRFVSTIPEMGDEGRLPPPLDGVGDKLRPDWLTEVISSGDDSRPAMRTQMPGFGRANVGHLPSTLAVLDQRNDADVTEIDEPQQRIVATGRKLVGSAGLACVGCHTFGEFKASGIQAIALDTMAARIRHDWFYRYLADPQQYRPGTRMPKSFPEGQSTVTDIYGGDPEKQLTAMWTFLKQGVKGGVPEGIVGGMIELKPADKPIIYRNFIAGVSPRGIAVGYPEKANLCWDASAMSLALLWQDRFIDASKHWIGRGPGNQVPLGGSVTPWESTAPVAVLADDQASWPSESPRQSGYRFLGYQLDPLGRPTFRYRGAGFVVADKPIPVAGDLVGTFRREVSITPTADAEPGKIFFRAAAGQVQPDAEGGFFVNQAIHIRLESPAEPIIRSVGNTTEVLIPVSGPTTIVQHIEW